jgi:hypothetical protein
MKFKHTFLYDNKRCIGFYPPKFVPMVRVRYRTVTRVVDGIFTQVRECTTAGL